MEVVNKHEGVSRHDRARFIIRASESWTGVQANQVPTSSSNKEKAE